MTSHSLNPRQVCKLVRQGQADARDGRPSRRRLYRVARPSILGGHSALHRGPSALCGLEWMYGVEGELLWTSRVLAQVVADAQHGLVQDVTGRYTGSVHD